MKKYIIFILLVLILITSPFTIHFIKLNAMEHPKCTQYWFRYEVGYFSHKIGGRYEKRLDHDKDNTKCDVVKYL